MATFTEEDIQLLRQLGNDECAKTWLGLWDAKRALKMDHRDFMVEKYERKRYYLEPASPLKSIPSTKNGSGGDLSSSTSSSESATGAKSAPAAAVALAAPTATIRLNKPTLAQTSSDPNSLLFKTCSITKTNKTNGFGSAGSSISSTSSSYHSSNSNHFDTDFAVDFSKADIFSASTNGHQQAVSNHQQQHHHHNKLISNSSSLVNGSANANSKLLNGTKLANSLSCSVDASKFSNGFVMTNGETGGSTSTPDNWADFEHNQIYNAAGKSCHHFYAPQ